MLVKKAKANQRSHHLPVVITADAIVARWLTKYSEDKAACYKTFSTQMVNKRLF